MGSLRGIQRIQRIVHAWDACVGSLRGKSPPEKASAPSGSSLKTCGLDTCLPVIAGQHGPAVGGQSASGVRRWQPCISNVSSVFWDFCENSLSYDKYKVMRHVRPTCRIICCCCSNLRDCGHGCRVLRKSHMAMSSMSPNPFLVKAVNTTDNLPFRVSVDKIGTSRWPYRWIPPLPAMVSAPRYGKVEILQV